MNMKDLYRSYKTFSNNLKILAIKQAKLNHISLAKAFDIINDQLNKKIDNNSL